MSNPSDMVPFMVPVGHYPQHVALEAQLNDMDVEHEPEQEPSQAGSWPQDKVGHWAKTSGPASRKVFSCLAEDAPGVKTTSQIAATTQLPVTTVRAVFAGLGRRVKRNKRLQGPWPVHGEWGGDEVHYYMEPEIAERWKAAITTL